MPWVSSPSLFSPSSPSSHTPQTTNTHNSRAEEDGEALVETHSAHARIGTALDRADALLRRLKVSKEEREGAGFDCLIFCLLV
jgi:hypothetical protein